MNYTRTENGSNYLREGLQTAGTAGATSPLVDAPDLIEHGIFTENSDLRAHVCFDVGGVYIFETAKAVDLILTGQYEKRPAWQNGVNGQTADGYLVPVWDIEDIKFSYFPVRYTRDGLNSMSQKSTSEKGRIATSVVKRMIELGALPIPLKGREPDSVQVDIDGTDLIVVANLRIQVKCDFRGGCEKQGGTGNLYIQTAECNPLRMY